MVVRRLALRAVHASGPAPVYQSTVGAVLKRTAGRIPDRLALTFADRRWSYAELDRGAGRVAAALLGLGLSHGDRVAAFGKNSDAYLLLYLGCARAGLVHVPVNFNARGDELAYLLTQSEPAAVFSDPALEEHVEAVAGALGSLRRGSLRHDVLAWALDDGGALHEEQGVRDDDLVQLLALIAFAKGRLAPHKVPKSVHRVDELPKNASGKVLKRELRRQLGGSASAVGRVSAADS